MSGSRVLVTGGAGFIGSAVCRHLVAGGHHVVNVDKLTYSGNLASLLAYYAFFSVFPLLLVAVTVLGFVLQGSPALQNQVFDTTLGFFPIIGQHDALHPLTGNWLALLVGIALALFSGLSVVSQAQNAFNTVLAVPRADWPGFVPRLLRSLELLVVGGGGLVLTTLISGAVTRSRKPDDRRGKSVAYTSPASQTMLTSAAAVHVQENQTAARRARRTTGSVRSGSSKPTSLASRAAPIAATTLTSSRTRETTMP